MSVTMSRADGVATFTLTSDPQSRWPPLCQILKSLCYSPVCCSVSRQLGRVQRTSSSVLGTLHIMTGLISMGLSAIISCTRAGSWYRSQMDRTNFPYWLGALFILFGISCILSEKYPSPCLVILNTTLNLAGVAFAIAAIVLYSINMSQLDVRIWCDQRYYFGPTSPTLSEDEQHLRDQCLEGRQLIQMLLRGINGVLIVLSVLELCVVFSSAVVGIKALRNSGTKDQDQDARDVELYKPLLEEVTAKPDA
ncbi:transmembrane protein 176B-like [Cololabis saira]|uniref:transmembrane protein 176B-like n=1 Tax=Cololabis saira TaxID=129043 RepID=UPI002AD51906|nr:transmembrane protein 176B-like [Cololabis saira]XP_061573399.1 transmembrane protein 176B-like [Cololabis saira]